MSTLGLVMLVRDEASVLEATLRSVKPLISSWTVVDTGSVDDTPAIVTRELAGVPGVLHHAEWEGFAHNRTDAVRRARGQADYHLFLDADLLVEAELPLPELELDSYRVCFPGDFEMWLPLVLRDGLDWRWEGAAHSYLAWPAGRTEDDLPQIRLREQRTSSPRADKLERDLELLEEEISPRTIFYMAQTLRDLGHDREAADLYRFRVRLSSENQQDVFWACYQEGLLRLKTDGLAVATPILLEAYSRRPSRIEPLWKLAREYRLAGRPSVALLFAEQAAYAPRPTDRGFVLAWVYAWGALQELALTLLALGRELDAQAVFHQMLKRQLSEEAELFVKEQLADLEVRRRPQPVGD